MWAVEIRVAATNLGATLCGMREFLDRCRAIPSRFETVSDGSGTVIVRVEFDGPDTAEAFRREFDPAV
jgi:hypothetical protein